MLSGATDEIAPIVIPSIPKAWLGAPLIAAMLLAACGGTKDPQAAGARGGPTKVGYVVINPTSVPLMTQLGGRVVAFETVRGAAAGLRRDPRALFHRRHLSSARASRSIRSIRASIRRMVAQAQANVCERARQRREAARDQGRRATSRWPQMEAISKQDYTDAAGPGAAGARRGRAEPTPRSRLPRSIFASPASRRRSAAASAARCRPWARWSPPTRPMPLAIITSARPDLCRHPAIGADLLTLSGALASGGTVPGSTQVRLKLDDGSDYGFTGTVQFSEDHRQRKHRHGDAARTLPEPAGRCCCPGMFVQAAFTQAVDPNVFLVPQQAVQRDIGGEAYVFVVGPGNKAVRRKRRRRPHFWPELGGNRRASGPATR